MSEVIHLWRGRHMATKMLTKCGLPVNDRMNVLYASTAAKLKIPPGAVCKTCYRVGPPWLGEVK